MEQTPDSKIGELNAGPSNLTLTEPKVENTDLVIETNVPKEVPLTYQSTDKGRKDLRRWENDYSRLRRVCRFLDETDDLLKPIYCWFWPDESFSLHVDDSDSDNSSFSESETEEDKNEREKREIEKLQQRVYQISKYLREKYNYCLWCGLRYEDEKDMEEACPGLTRDDHPESSGTTQSDEEEN